MAIDINSALFLIDAKKRGVKFGKLITLGRLHMAIYHGKLMKTLYEHGLPSCSASDFSEPFFRAIGATETHSVDMFPDEGADIIHDLNLPVPSKLVGQFDTVIDGGTLEHIFNFPVAIRNCMEMLKIGGRCFIHTVVNNASGHGFYQFCPELFFRVFCAENGFKVERIVLHRVGPYCNWFEALDPAQTGLRGQLINFTPILMLVQARKVRNLKVFAAPPQQSDYVQYWKNPSKSPYLKPTPKLFVMRLQRWLPELSTLLRAVKTACEFYSTQSLWNRRFFRRVKKPRS